MSTTAKDESCPYCGATHIGTCPRVSKIEYHPDGAIKAVEFFGPQSFDVSGLSIDQFPKVDTRLL